MARFVAGVLAGVGSVWLLGRWMLRSPVLRQEFRRRLDVDELVLPTRTPLTYKEAEELRARFLAVQRTGPPIRRTPPPPPVTVEPATEW